MTNIYFIDEQDLLEAKNEVLDFFKNAIDYSNGNYNEEYFKDDNVNIIDDDINYYQLADYYRMNRHIKVFKLEARHYNHNITDDDIKKIYEKYNRY